ncbi:unnamed protein product [Camellia sinensis]
MFFWVDGLYSQSRLDQDHNLLSSRTMLDHHLLDMGLHMVVNELLKVQNELLDVYSTQLLEMENSRCRVLLRDDKVEDLSTMYRLCHKIPKALEPVANIFKQHVTAEG